MKRLIAMVIVALTVIEFVSAAPEVTDITAKQRYPWNGLVDITCRVAGIEADAGGYEFSVVAVDKETGREYTVSTFSIQHNGEEVPDVCSNGDYSLLWNAREDMGQIVIERMAVRITLEALAASVGKVQLWEGVPYWADRNIGAKNPESYGLYFWWGDTIGHHPSGTTFDFNFSLNVPTINKSIATLQSEGWIVSKDGINVLALANDAARVKWGGRWRMPMYQELHDLCNNKCDWAWTTMNGVKGYVVRGRGTYAASSIFLPAAGNGCWSELYHAGSCGYYWSSVPTDSSATSYSVYFDSGRHVADHDSRYEWFTIRPVQGPGK
jgi:hypothetical protein